MTLSEWLTRLAVGSDRKTTITNFWFIGEPTVVRGNGRINQLGPDRLQPREGAALVRPDQS